MKMPPAHHLPLSAAWRRWRPLAETACQVPVLDVSDVVQVWEALDEGARLWRLRALPSRLEALAAALASLRRRGPGAWRPLLARSTGLSPEGIDAAWEVTFAPHREQALHDALRAEHLDALALDALEAARRLPERIAHVLAGNVLASTLSVLLRGWILGAAQWLRPAAREPFLAVCLLEDLRLQLPELAACTAVLWWPHDAWELERAVLGAADVVTIQASDASIAAMRQKWSPQSSQPQWVPYGSRWSAAVVSAAAQTPETAAALSWDVALFDQQGCLSPTLVFAERSAGLQAWCAAVAAALDALESRIPRGDLPAAVRAALRHGHEKARLDMVSGTVAGFWENGTRWAVALRAACDLEESPLDRHVIVVPFETWPDIPRAAAQKLEALQGLALALDGWSESARTALVESMRPSRVAPVGRLQEAPLAWRQDHRPPFASLLLPV